MFIWRTRGYASRRKKSFVEGFRSGRTKIILELLQDDILSIDDAAKKLAITTDELEEKLKHQ